MPFRSGTAMVVYSATGDSVSRRVLMLKEEVRENSRFIVFSQVV